MNVGYVSLFDTVIGNTTDSDSVTLGSIPGIPARKT